MNRELLQFSGIDMHTGQRVYGKGCIDPYDGPTEIINIGVFRNKYHAITPETFGQATGFYDKKGDMIYTQMYVCHRNTPDVKDLVHYKDGRIYAGELILKDSEYDYTIVED